MPRRLEAAADVALIATCVVVMGAVGWRFVQNSRTRPASQQPFPRGERVQTLDGVDYGGYSRTVLVALSSTCKYCTASVPFYKSLAELRQSSDRRVQLVAVSWEETARISSYLSSHGFIPDHVVSIAPGRLPIRGTPTLVILDSAGRVLESWQGRLSRSAEESVKELLFGRGLGQ